MRFEIIISFLISHPVVICYTTDFKIDLTDIIIELCGIFVATLDTNI